MAVEIAGTTVGLARPLALAALPVAALLFAALALRGDGTAGRRRRAVLLGSRLLIALLLVGAAAGPYTVTTERVPGDPRVTMLVDRSASTSLAPPVADDLAAAIEREGVPVTRRVVASGEGSPIGDAAIAGLGRNGSVLLVTDGQVTGGRSLAEAGELARDVNATLYAVPVEPDRPEARVRLSGPRKTSVDVDNQFFVRVSGVDLEGDRSVRVEVDGEAVNTTTVDGAGGFSFTHAFEETGTHRVSVTLDADDTFDANDAYYRTVRVVEKPEVLYVAREDRPLGEFLAASYDVDRAERVPDDLDDYLTVVLQDVPADSVGNLTALRDHVVDGNGLVVVGGPNAYGNGGYDRSRLSTMLPVRNGSSGTSARIALSIDISSSTQEGLATQKAIALDVVNQLGDENAVGAVAFDQVPYELARVRPLSASREELSSRIRRLQSGGGTEISAGLRGAGSLLGGGGGTVILLSDGQDSQLGEAIPVARGIRERGGRLIVVGVGNEVDVPGLRRIAAAGGGTYLSADETNRLRVLFGGETRPYTSDQLVVVDPDSFITAGVELTAAPERTHRVSAKQGADLLVAGDGGLPAITTWRFGLGRVVSVTAYDADGSLGGLLSAPDSLVITKSVNWAIGDPQRNELGVVEVRDARVNTTATVTARVRERPSAPGLRFVRTGPDSYEATFTPDRSGYGSVLETTYAANYHPEYAAFGTASGLDDAVATTGGTTFGADEAAAIAATVKRRAAAVRDVRRDLSWLLLVAGLLLYLLEVSVRRLDEVTDRRLLPA